MASEGGKRAEVGDPAKTTDEGKARTEVDDPAKTTDEKEAPPEEDDPTKTTGEQEARAEEDDLDKTTDEKEAPTEEADLAKTANETEEDEYICALDLDTFGAFTLTMADEEPSEGSWRPQQVSITNNSNQQLSPRMLTPRPRSQVTLNPAAAPWSPNRITRPVIQEPAFVDHNYAFGMPQQHHYPNAAAPVMMYEQHRGQAPMWPVMYNPPQAQIVFYGFPGQAPMMYNQLQEQIVQAPMRPMVYNQQQQQFNQGGQHFGVPNNAASPRMYQQHQNLVRGQAPVRPMVYNNQHQQQQFNQGQHFGFPNNAAAAPRPELDQEMQQLQLQMQQPAESQGSSSGPSSTKSQD